MTDRKIKDANSKRRRVGSTADEQPAVSKTVDVVEKAEEEADKTLTSTTPEASLADGKVSQMKRLRINDKDREEAVEDTKASLGNDEATKIKKPRVAKKDDDDIFEDTEATAAVANVPENMVEDTDKPEEEETMADDTSKPVVDEVNGDSAKSQEEAKPIEDSGKSVADEKDTEKEPEEKGETKDEETEKKPDEKVEAKKEGESQPMPAKHIFGSGFSSGRGFGIVNSDGGLTGVAGAPSSFASCNTADSGFAKYTTKPKSFEVMLSDGSSKSLETATTEQKPKIVETVEIKTHEENETCVFSTKAKLFQFKDGDWKSRGKGHFKVNQHKIDEKCRLVMRTDITFQVMLNSMLFHGMTVRRRDEKSVFFVCIDHQSNKLASYILALDNEDLAQEAYSAIRNHIPGTVDNAAQKTEKVEVPDEGKSDDEDGAKLSGTESVAGDSSAEDSVKDAEN